jgi:hypothetical protein
MVAATETRCKGTAGSTSVAVARIARGEAAWQIAQLTQCATLSGDEFALLSRGPQVRVLPGAPGFSHEIIRKFSSSVFSPVRQHSSEALIFRVADRVAGPFAWQAAWQQRCSSAERA